jgi:hypothetical protein
MRLDDCNPEEVTILVAIVALSNNLPGDFRLYSQAIGEIRRKHFRKPGRTLGNIPKGYATAKRVRVSR